MMDDPANELRRRWAGEAMDAYLLAKGERIADEADLSDLMHWADRSQHNDGPDYFQRQLETAMRALPD